MFMTKESTRNNERRQKIDKLSEKNKRNIVGKHLVVNNKTTEDVDENDINLTMDSSSDNDDVPLSQRYNQLSAITLRSSRMGKRMYTCQICNIIFDRKNKLEIHMIKHNDSRSYKCNVCSKNFKTHSNMMRHMEFHCEPKQIYTCGVCNFKARCKSNLMVHYKKRHADEYKFSCEHCGEMFKLKADQTVHMRVHEIESCVCDICGSCHSNKNSLYHHRQYKHLTSRKDYECKTCKKRFSTMKNLKNHGKLHEMKYVCEQCGMEFKRRYGLTKHMRTHSAEKKCLCAICGKTFKSLSAQKVHLLTHVGERPYVCDICGKSFTQRSPMMLHRRTKHPEITVAPPPIKITDLLHGVKDKIITNQAPN